MSTFQYRTPPLGQSWIVAVWLTASAVPVAEFSGNATEIADGIRIDIPDRIPSVGSTTMRLTEDERRCLELGLKVASERTRSFAADRLPMVVRIEKLLFAETDYQPEGLACTMAGWAAEEFGFPPMTIPVSFDALSKRYVFQFDRIISPSDARP